MPVYACFSTAALKTARVWGSGRLSLNGSTCWFRLVEHLRHLHQQPPLPVARAARLQHRSYFPFTHTFLCLRKHSSFFFGSTCVRILDVRVSPTFYRALFARARSRVLCWRGVNRAEHATLRWTGGILAVISSPLRVRSLTPACMF